jgi:hypothetical protein
MMEFVEVINKCESMRGRYRITEKRFERRYLREAKARAEISRMIANIVDFTFGLGSTLMGSFFR